MTSCAQEAEEVDMGGSVTGEAPGRPAGGLLLEVLLDALPAGQRRLAQLFPHVAAGAQLQIQLFGAFNGLALGNVAESLVDLLAVVEPLVPVAPVSAVEVRRPALSRKSSGRDLAMLASLGICWETFAGN